MALIIDLKPNEKILVGNTTITNDNHRTRLHIDGEAPILREKDALSEDDALTPAKKIYFTVQTMHLSPSNQALNQLDDYFYQAKELQTLAPYISDFLSHVTGFLLQGFYYKALKLLRDLIDCEDKGTSPKTNHKQDCEPSPSAKMEAQMLIQSAQQLQNLYDQWDDMDDAARSSILSYNRKLWMVFFDDRDDLDVGTKPHPALASSDIFDIKTNIIHLYDFIYKRCADITKGGDKEKIHTLIKINEETAKNLC